MKGIMAVYLKELRSYFTSPMAFIVIGVFLMIMGYFFFSIMQYFNISCTQTAGYTPSEGMPPLNVNEWVIQPLFMNMAVILLLIMPIMTMRIFAEEKKLGTMELLMTAPLNNFQIVMGKFLGCLTIYCLFVGLTGGYFIIINKFSIPDMRQVYTGFLGMFLLGMTFTAIGIWASSMTKDQLIAAVITFGILILMWVMGWMADISTNPFVRAVGYMSTMDRLEGMIKGLIKSKDVIYFLSLTFFGLAMTSISIDSTRWKE